MPWTLGEVMSRSTTALGNRTDIPLSDASFWANEAHRIVWDSLPHDLQEQIAISSTTSGENRVTLPGDFQELLNLRISSSSTGHDVLQQLNIDTIDSASTSLGVPTKYAPFGDWIELWPSPDSAYSLQMRYRQQLTDISATTTRLSVATRYGYAVFLKSAQLLGENVIRDFESATAFEDKYLRYMNQTVPDRGLRQRERHDTTVSLLRKPR